MRSQLFKLVRLQDPKINKRKRVINKSLSRKSQRRLKNKKSQNLKTRKANKRATKRASKTKKKS